MAKRTASGKFRGKVTIGYDPDGKPIYKYVTAPTRRELENVKEAVREHYIFGRAIPRDQPFYEYAGQWYRIKKEPFISNASRSYYKTCFVKHLLPQFGMQHMKAISAAQIQEFVSGFAGASKSQINNVIGTLKAIFASALSLIHIYGGLGHAAFDEKLVLRHPLFLQQLRQPCADRLIELHSITIPVAVPIL